MNFEEAKLLVENNLILRTLTRVKLIEVVNEIKKIGIKNMDLGTVKYYRELVAEFTIPCGYGMPLYDSCGEEVYRAHEKLSERYNELYTELQANSIKTAKEELNINE